MTEYKSSSKKSAQVTVPGSSNKNTAVQFGIGSRPRYIGTTVYLTLDAQLKVFLGGQGGRGGNARGGWNEGIGGHGGEGGGAPITLTATIEMLATADIYGGIGGDGGDGVKEGGTGGIGQAHQIVEDKWFFDNTDGLPHMSIEDFCKLHKLSDTIREALKRYGIETVKGAVAMTAEDLDSLKEFGLEGGHIATLRGALRGQMAKR
ncbi:hypothetical protein B0H17DRAFT_1138529 [Mycena rosella]|uniref:Uncharacterized protein n=1 Tax=Mycena rosella TaxID=1033263 RepID=A0AAD7D685_MYCRO|nr:hypothetical protein B0H17DRAFT_1138529 [Mycena rosella]